MTAGSNSGVHNRQDAVVEDFRIDIDDEGEATVARLRMRYGEGMHRYHLHSRVHYSDDDSEGHRVTIRRLHDDAVVETLETEWTTAESGDEFDITQELHETYVQTPDDWHDFSVAADAQERRERDWVGNLVAVLANDDGNFAYEARVFARIGEYDVTIHAEHVEESTYSPGIDYSLRFFRNDSGEEVLRVDRCWPADDYDSPLDFLDYVKRYARLEITDGLQLARLHDDDADSAGGECDE